MKIRLWIFNDKYDKCDWNIKKKAQKWILEAVWRLFCVSFVDASRCVAKTNNGQVGK